jgi:hypothetical protein
MRRILPYGSASSHLPAACLPIEWSNFLTIRPLHSRIYNQGRGIPNKKVRTVSMATFLSNSEFTRLATEARIAKTMRALEAHSIRVVVFETSEEARKYVLDLISSGADVYNSSSRTLELIGLADDIEHPTRFQSVRAVAFA